MIRELKTKEDVRAVFSYKDGHLIWAVPGNAQTPIGTIAGSPLKDGYKVITYKRKKYMAHRLIFLYHHGHLPGFVDHIDRDRENNRIENLRECTASENQFNTKARKNSRSGIKGVCWNKQMKKWEANVCANHKRHFCGLFDDIEVAAQVVRIERLRLHGQFTNHG
jgi:hypothetical protein